MNVPEIEKQFTASIIEVLKMGDHNVPRISSDSKPLEIPFFDSYSGMTAIIAFEQKTETDLSDLENRLFLDEKHRMSTIHQISLKIHELIRRKGGKT